MNKVRRCSYDLSRKQGARKEEMSVRHLKNEMSVWCTIPGNESVPRGTGQYAVSIMSCLKITCSEKCFGKDWQELFYLF